MAEDYPSPEHGADTLAGQMDMSSELANQAAAEAAVAAAVGAIASEPEGNAQAGPSHHHSASPDPRLPQPGQGPPPPPAYQRQPRASGSSAPTPLPFQFGPPHRQAPDSHLSNSQQLVVLREFYARNPNPSKKELEMLAEKTGRPWTKIREYFRQRRNKLRGLVDLEEMEEPGRATGWLQVTYRPGPATSTVSQLNLYNAYKTRFDPYASASPLLGGQELIQLACATFPGCEMARDDGDYVVRGLRDKDGVLADSEWDRGLDQLVEPLRGSTWLLSSFQHPADPAAPASIAQTELYTAYAARFGTLQPDAGAEGSAEPAAHEDEFEASMRDAKLEAEMDDINSFLPPAPEAEGSDERDETGAATPATEAPRENRLLNPVELINLARMTFPKCEPAVDDDGRFVIRGLERREGEEKGRGVRPLDMFPFALASGPKPSDPTHPFTSLIKRKLALLTPEPDPPAKRRAYDGALNGVGSGIGVNIGVGVPVGVAATAAAADDELAEADRELLDGLRRFRGSKLGKEVRDTCVQQ
ncbi:hypothetical protein Q8F55_005250 [Vanrija albida]|uniref:Homeobox domain-containing protein n=1 Tax=Vanrija albida TaxID=181172 RepID=A0ABR3Q203_9TREE